MDTSTTTPAGDPAGQFQDRLLAAILADYDELAATPTRAPRRLARRAAPVLLAGTAVAAAGLVAAGVIVPGGAAPHPATRSADHPATPAHVETAAYVLRHVRAAVSAPGSVLVIREHAPDSQTGRPVDMLSWSGPGDTSRSETLDAHGRPVTGVVLTIRPHTTISISVNYRQRTWSTTTYPFGAASAASGPAPLPQTPAQNAARLRAGLTAGTIKLVGPGVVDGQRALQLTQGSARSGLQDMWVSSRTFLPIRVIDTAPGVSQASPQAIRDDYQWLAATPAHLRLLTAAAAIPAGFTQVPGH